RVERPLDNRTGEAAPAIARERVHVLDLRGAAVVVELAVRDGCFAVEDGEVARAERGAGTALRLEELIRELGGPVRLREGHAAVGVGDLVERHLADAAGG